VPKLTVGETTAEVAEGTRLVVAIEELGVHIGHRCGGNARCTTCRVTFAAGEPETMTAAEYAKLKERGLYGQYRLSCQIECRHDMAVAPVMTLENQDWTDTGPPPEPTVQPEAVFLPRSELERAE
jgi:ferredoxin